MDLIDNNNNNVKEFPVKSMPRMFCFGGNSTCIQADKIKHIEFVFWQSFKTSDYIPTLLVTLKDDTQICIYYDSEEEAQEVIKTYKKGFIKVL